MRCFDRDPHHPSTTGPQAAERGAGPRRGSVAGVSRGTPITGVAEAAPVNRVAGAADNRGSHTDRRSGGTPRANGTETNRTTAAVHAGTAGVNLDRGASETQRANGASRTNRTIRALSARGALVFGAVVLGGCLPPMLAGPAPVSGLAGELDAIFADPALAHAHWGAAFRSLDSGQPIYAINQERLFVPASALKLFTGAAALETLGREWEYRTSVAAGGLIRNGVLEGSLVVIGTGDPTFSGRFHGESRDVFRIWADSLRAQGITRIAGGVVAVDTAFTDPPLGAGWAWEDTPTGFSAEFGPLQFNESVVDLEIFPSGTMLSPAIVVLTPATQYVRIINDTRTVPAGSLTNLAISREDAGSVIVVRGEIAADVGAVNRTVAIRDPGLYFASVLRETLREQGIPVEGPAISHASLDPYDPALRFPPLLFSFRSPPLGQILSGMMKPSQNLIAETILRTVGRELRADGSAVAGAAVVDSLLRAWEFPALQHRMADGSGLSRYNLVSPLLLVDLLQRMDRSYYREDWLASLPVAGVDGTLATRMRDDPLRERVVAKTGTLGGVRALAGYLTTARGERIAFAMIVNGHVVTAADVDRVMESALERIATAR